MSKRLTETSKFLSYVLRHEPQSIGLSLDTEGWASVDALIAAAAQHEHALRRCIDVGVKALDKAPARGTDADQADSGVRPAVGGRV